MGIAFYIVLDRQEAGFDPFVNGKFLAQEAQNLDRLCHALGVKTLADYVSYTPDEAEALLAEFGDKPDGVTFPEAKWFPAAEGLALTEKLADYLADHPQSVHQVDGVLTDLNEFRQVLEQALKIRANWHLQVDF